MMSQSPRVTVVIPAFNRAHCISAAIRSIRSQKMAGIEIIIVDDGSSDELESRIADSVPNLQVIRHPKNLGAAAARNTGISAAKGEYIAFLDSDDYWHPEKLQSQLDFMSRTGLRACCTGFAILRNGALVDVKRPYRDHVTLQNLVWGCFTSPGSTLIVEREVLLSVDGYDTRYARLEDWDLLLRLALDANVQLGYLPITLATIAPAGPPSFHAVKESTKLLETRFLSVLIEIDPQLARHFVAALDFEIAAAARSKGDLLRSIQYLSRSLLKVRRGHEAFQIILGSRLLRRAELS